MGEIEKDLRSWSSEVLEVPNQNLKGLSACPYAKEAWKKDKVLVVENITKQFKCYSCDADIWIPRTSSRFDGKHCFVCRNLYYRAGDGSFFSEGNQRHYIF